MRPWLATCLVLPAATLLGCGDSPVGRQSVEKTRSGTIDTSLSREDRAKQQVIHDVLVNLQEGYPTEQISSVLKGVKFADSQSEFLDGGQFLVRWDFDGPPSGSKVPVALYFAGLDGSTSNLREIKRTYHVRRSAGRFTVTRQ